ncbi:MAG TPA: Dabb family protein [Puia sp.]|nr:Dabb family protein [Puia sp.]
MREDKNIFIHHVYFWLANPENAEERQQLLEGLRKLSKAPTIKRFHIGRPAGTNRNVIDTTYSFSWCILFDSAAEQESYQTDPIHLRFVKECSHLWRRVQVYDSVDI